MADVEMQRSDALTNRINAKYREVEGLARSAVEAGIELGQLLVEKRKALGHGEWGPWLESHFEGSRSHAYNFITLYEERDKLLEGNVQRVGQTSLRSALQALSASDPFEEVFAYVEREVKRLAAIDTPGEIPPLPSKPEGEDKEASFDYRRKAAKHHHLKAERGMKMVGEGYLEMLNSVRGMRDGGYDSEARGWLREALISMSIHTSLSGGGTYGVLYRGAVTNVRVQLSELIPEDNPIAQSTAERLKWCGYLHGTVTIDLAEEETTLAKVLAPDALEEVDEAWEEDKDYELAIRKMETFVCPGDVPPSREGGGYRSSLSEEQLRTPFAELRSSGELYEALEAGSENEA